MVDETTDISVTKQLGRIMRCDYFLQWNELHMCSDYDNSDQI